MIRKLTGTIGERVTAHMRAIAPENPRLQGIVDRVDLNATSHSQRNRHEASSEAGHPLQSPQVTLDAGVGWPS